MIAIEMEAPIINHSISVSSDQLPTNAPRARVIVLYDEADTSPDLPNIEFSKATMAHALLGLEEDPVTYTGADIKERWQ